MIDEYQTWPYVATLFRPSGEVQVGAPGDRYRYNGAFELSPEVVGGIDQIICFGCELIISADVADPGLMVSFSPNEHGNLAQITHEKADSSYKHASLTADFILEDADVDGYVDFYPDKKGSLTLEGTRTGFDFVSTDTNFIDNTVKVN